MLFGWLFIVCLCVFPVVFCGVVVLVLLCVCLCITR